jgi:hypothetical protein
MNKISRAIEILKKGTEASEELETHTSTFTLGESKVLSARVLELGLSAPSFIHYDFERQGYYRDLKAPVTPQVSW